MLGVQETKCEESISWDKFAKLNLSEHHQVSTKVIFVSFISHSMVFRKKKYIYIYIFSVLKHKGS